MGGLFWAEKRRFRLRVGGTNMGRHGYVCVTYLETSLSGWMAQAASARRNEHGQLETPPRETKTWRPENVFVRFRGRFLDDCGSGAPYAPHLRAPPPSDSNPRRVPHPFRA